MKDKEEKQTHRPSFGLDVSISFGNQVLTFLAAAITGIVIARTLGPKGKGLYSLAIRIPAIAATLASLGINFANVYFIGKKRHPLGLVVGNAFLYSTFSGIAIALLFFVSVPFLASHLLKGAPRVYLYLALPMIPFLLIFDNMYYIFLGHRKMVKLAIFSLGRHFSYLVILIAFYYFMGLSIYRTLWAYIFGLVVALVIGVYFLIESGYLAGLSVDRKVFVESLKFGARQHLGTISRFLNYRLDLLIIAVLLSPLHVGLYSVAVLVGEAVWYISKAMAQILYPKTVASDAETADKFTPLVCRSTVLLTLIAVLILYSIAGLVIPWLFTSRFYPSVMALKLLLPGIFFLSISRVLGSDLIGRGFPQYSSIASSISLVVTVILNLLLIPRLGINGASIASSIAYTAHAVVILYLFKKTTGIRLSDLVFFKVSDFIFYRKRFKSFHL